MGEPDWEALELQARRTGHVLCECPDCGFKQFVSYRPKSKPWPQCMLPGCTARIVPIVDVSLVRKNPGKPRTKKQLAEDGFVLRTSRSTKNAARKRVAAPRSTSADEPS